MEKIWSEMYEAARAVWNGRRISEYVTCTEVSAAVLSKRGRIVHTHLLNARHLRGTKRDLAKRGGAIKNSRYGFFRIGCFGFLDMCFMRMLCVGQLCGAYVPCFYAKHSLTISCRRGSFFSISIACFIWLRARIRLWSGL